MFKLPLAFLYSNHALRAFIDRQKGPQIKANFASEGQSLKLSSGYYQHLSS